MTAHIRNAQPDDAHAIAHVHVESWRTTYKGIMPDELLASLTYEDREQMWSATLSRIEAGTSTSCLFVAEVEGQLVGFACGGRERTGHPVYKGELYAIYLLEVYQGQGIGRALARAVAQHLIGLGYTTMLIWVAEQNPAVHFYEALGGHPVASKNEDFRGQSIREIAYGYDDLNAVVSSGDRG